MSSMKTLAILVFLFGYGATAMFPSYIKQCKNDATINKCVLENINIVKDHFHKPIPKLFMPQFSPFTIPKFEILTPTLNITGNNLILHNLQTFNIKDFNIDLVKNEVFVDITFPMVQGDCDYLVDGKLLLLELHGDGKAKLNLSNVHAILKMTGEQIVKDNQHFVSLNKSDLKLSVEGKSSINLDNLIRNNKELSDATAKVINENIEDFIKELIPFISETFGQIADGILKGVFSHYSLEQLFI